MKFTFIHFLKLLIVHIYGQFQFHPFLSKSSYVIPFHLLERVTNARSISSMHPKKILKITLLSNKLLLFSFHLSLFDLSFRPPPPPFSYLSFWPFFLLLLSTLYSLFSPFPFPKWTLEDLSHDKLKYIIN